MSLRLVVKSATDLPKLDRFSKIDPYCEMVFHEEKQSTTMIANNQNPEWNESFKWTLEVVPETTEAIEIHLMDHETLGKNRLVCKGSIPLASVIENGSTSLDVAVVDPKEEPLDAKVHVDLSYRAPISEALHGEVAALKARIEELEELLKNLKATVAEKETELKELNERIEPLKTENANAKAKIEQLEAELATIGGGEDLKTQNESLANENAALKRRIEELEKQQRSQAQSGYQPASGVTAGHEQQPLIHAEVDDSAGGEKKTGCCTLL